jgi:transposase
MVTPRRPLGVISGNVQRRRELKPHERGKVIGASIAGATPGRISTLLNIPDQTVRDTISQDILRDDHKSKPRTGRPKCYTERDERMLLRHVRQFPKQTYAQVMNETQLGFSRSTVRRILQDHGIANWRAKKRPHLTQAHADARLGWCTRQRDWTAEDFRKYMWSDECSAERGKGKAGVWYFGTPVQKWDKEMVDTYHKGKDISVMVWGCFWGTIHGIGRSELFVLERDFESKKHGYSARSYLEVLDDQLPKCWSPGLEFMQDGASIHTARVVRKWFEDNGIPLVEWPPFSPDLNPIEHVWWHLKKAVLDQHPELTDMGEGEEAIQALESALCEAWDSLPDTLFESLIDSMPRRVAACIAAEGWHTRY